MSGQAEEVTLEWSAFSSFLASQHVVLLFLEESNDHLILAKSKLNQEEDWPILLDFFQSQFST